MSRSSPRARALTIATVAIAMSTGSLANAAPRGYDGVRSSEWRDDGVEAPAPAVTPSADVPSVPPPRPVDAKHERVAIAVGLAPEAPGSKAERALLDRLFRTSSASIDPPTTVRRLRPGVGDARSICRDRRDDMVVFIGYVPRRDEPVVLAHDCRLDVPLGVRASAAVDEPGLVGALVDERDELVRQGMHERRRLGKLSPKARAGIAAGVAIIVIGTAIGLLVANALRDEKVVLKVAP